MTAPRRPIAFILASTDHGAMILNRNDHQTMSDGRGYGVGFSILTKSGFDVEESAAIVTLLDLRRKHFGDGVVALDLGANIGAFTIDWARHMTDWGSVIAIEAQERIFHALCGNVALNNCFNARPLWAAVTDDVKPFRMPVPDYRAPASFGSLSLRPEKDPDFGQVVDYSDAGMMPVPALSVDSLGLSRVDLIKLDVEGMEVEALHGARRTIETHHPILVVEDVKSGRAAVGGFLRDFGYRRLAFGLNTVAIHAADPSGAFMAGI